MLVDKNWLICHSQVSEKRRINTSIKRPFVVLFARQIIAILCVSQLDLKIG